jgi:hypothetical protein
MEELAPADASALLMDDFHSYRALVDQGYFRPPVDTVLALVQTPTTTCLYRHQCEPSGQFVGQSAVTYESTKDYVGSVQFY